MAHIETTTAGSLPRTDALIAANAARAFEEDGFTLKTSPEHEALVAEAVRDVVERQQRAGITQPGERRRLRSRYRRLGLGRFHQLVGGEVAENVSFWY